MRPKAKNRAIEEPYNLNNIEVKTSNWYIIFVALAPVIILGFVYYTTIYTKSKQNAKIQAKDQLAAHAFERFIKAIKNGRDNQEIAFSVRDVGRLINASSQRESVLRVAQQQNFAFYTWNAISKISKKCNSFESSSKVKILLYILNDYAKIGGRFEASIPALESVLNNCNNDEEFINAVFSTLSIIGKNVKLPKGSAKLCEAQSKMAGHGPWSKYITSAIGNSDLSEEDDKVAFNNYMKSEMNEKERWSKGYVSIFCDAANKNSYTEAASLCSEL